MGAMITRRVVRSLISVWGVTTIVFFLLRLSGDPVTLLLPPDAPVAEIERVRTEMGLNQPLPVQYMVFLGKAAQFDFGRSIRLNQPAMAVALERLPATIELALTSFILAIVVAIPVGIVSAVKPNTWLDNSAMAIALLGQSAPTFYIGVMLILVFSVALGWFPTSGRGAPEQLVLPCVTLGLFAMASIARLTRSAVLEEIRRDYARVARAKGLSEFTVLMGHAFKNAAIPIVTITALQFGNLLGGAVVTETVFAWPGVGRLAITSIYSRDYPVVQSTVFLTAVMFVLLNLLVDILYTYLDPRIRLA